MELKKRVIKYVDKVTNEKKEFSIIYVSIEVNGQLIDIDLQLKNYNGFVYKLLLDTIK